jgi:hypothetical protein
MSEFNTPNAYVTVHTSDDIDAHTDITTAEASIITNDLSELFLDKPVNVTKGRSSSSYFAESIPEARGLTWTDTFFDEEEDTDQEIVAVFDFDYVGMERYYTQVGWVMLGSSLVIYPPIFALAMIGLVPCCLNQNVQWDVQSQHVAVTRDGIRFVKAKRRSCWGLSCTDRGKKSQTVPFDKITDCDIEEPAGNTCFCIPNILMKVNVDTASSGSQEHRHQLRITGLKDPYKFKKLVWAMKRANGNGGIGSSNWKVPVVTSLEMTERKVDGNEESVATLLRDIRSELRQNNELLQSMKSTGEKSE